MTVRILTVLLAGVAAMPTGAQQVAPDPDDADITVTAGKIAQPGAVLGDIKPEIQLSPADIRSYGVSSIADLLTELAPETRSDRGSGGAPLVLLNGRRISGFNEIKDIPTEAILRVDILPEEVALKYGYPADQRVINIVLRPRFRGKTAEAGGGAATEGGAANEKAAADYLRIQKNGRLNVDLQYGHTDALTEADRNIIAPVQTGLVDSSGALPDVTRYRTLTPDTDTGSLNIVYNHVLPGGVSATANVRAELDRSQGENGLAIVDLTVPPGSPFGPPAGPASLSRYATDFGALPSETKTSQLHFGGTVNGDGKRWHWSVIGNYDRTDTRTQTATGVDASAFEAGVLAGSDPLAAFGPLLPRAPNTSSSLSQTGMIDALVSGPLIKLPGGSATISVKMLGSASGFDGTSDRRGIATTTHFKRDIVSGQANFDLPITSSKTGFGDAIGDLTLNGNFAAQHLSDFGMLTTVGYGMNWAPVSPLTIIVSRTTGHAAPTAQQLQGPVTDTPNVAIFDPATGETVFVTQVSGGTAQLSSSEKRVTKIEFNLKPLKKPDLTLTANYIDTRITNAIAGFPATSAAIEAAFPERFIRDDDGNLVELDVRPVNFASESSATLRYGANLSIPLKSAVVNPFAGLRRPGGGGADGAPSGDGPPSGDGARSGSNGGGRGGGRGGFAGGGFGGPNGGRLMFAVYHSIYFRDVVVIRPGVPPLDLLNGGALGASGGQPRHEVDFQAGYSRNGLGARLSANWRSGTRVDASAEDPNGSLTFSPLATANLRLFANFGDIPGVVKAHPWLRGARLTFSITNITDARERVRDATGATPLAYQPGYLDPVGRAVSISFRKLFFSLPPRRPPS